MIGLKRILDKCFTSPTRPKLDRTVSFDDNFFPKEDLMKPLKILLMASLFVFAVSAPAFAQGPSPKGFDALFCIADVLLPGGSELKNVGDQIVLFGKQVRIVARSNVMCNSGGGNICEITVEIIHGASSSTHTLTFLDQNQPQADSLTCGDSVINVS
jgi:hypothetical protein